MKILIFGAGIIGKIYASGLSRSGVDITLLARGENHEKIKQHGVRLKNILTGEITTCHIPVTTEITPNEDYDLIIVTVRLDQLKSVSNVLKDSQPTAIMFMMNNIENLDELQQQYPDKEIILAFPGVGGTQKDDTIEFIQIKQQKTTLGNLNGRPSKLTLTIKEALIKSGFETMVTDHMKWWLKTHAVFITCVSAAIIKQNGDSKALGKNKKAVREMIDSIKEGFIALQDLGIEITPKNLKTIFLQMPKWFSVWYWRKAMKGPVGTLAIAPHAKVAKSEMQLLAENVLDLVHSSSHPTPGLDNLLTDFIQTEKNVVGH